MRHKLLRFPMLALSAALFLTLIAGCSDSDNNLLIPTPEETRTVGNDASVTFPTSGVRVVAAPDSFNPGDSVALSVVLNPANLPAQARNPAIHTKVASVVLSDSANSGIAINTPLSVQIPLIDREGVDNNTSVRLFSFSADEGRWLATGRQAFLADDTSFATFTVDSLGTYGVFRSIPLKVTIAPSRTTGNAPLSVGFNANISGGTPPYSVVWDFGDDEGGTGNAVSHLYEAPLNFRCSVTVTDAADEVATNIVDIYAH